MVNTKVGSGFPADVTVSTPMALTKTGRNYHFSFDTTGIVGATGATGPTGPAGATGPSGPSGSTQNIDTVAAFELASFEVGTQVVNILGYTTVGVGACQVKRIAAPVTWTATLTATTNSNTTVNVSAGKLSTSALGCLAIGQAISGTDIPASTTITAVDFDAGTITISNAATGSHAGVTLTVQLYVAGFGTGYFRSADRYLPNGSTDNTNGGYWQIMDMVVDPHMFGCPTNVYGGTNDGYGAIINALQFCAQFGQSLTANIKSIITLSFPLANYYSSEKIILPCALTMRTLNEQSALADFPATVILFAAGKAGIFSPRHIINPVFIGIHLLGPTLSVAVYDPNNAGYLSNLHGWEHRATAQFFRCSATYFQGHGFYENAPGSPTGIADYSYFETCAATGNVLNGFEILGADANVDKLSNCSAVNNMQYGFRDDAFLSGLLDTCHAAGNGNYGLVGTIANFTGSIALTTLTVTAIADGTIEVGQSVWDISGATIDNQTYIVSQLTGAAGSTGTYQVSVSQTVGSISTIRSGYWLNCQVNHNGSLWTPIPTYQDFALTDPSSVEPGTDATVWYEVGAANTTLYPPWISGNAYQAGGGFCCFAYTPLGCYVEGGQAPAYLVQPPLAGIGFQGGGGGALYQTKIEPFLVSGGVQCELQPWAGRSDETINVQMGVRAANGDPSSLWEVGGSVTGNLVLSLDQTNKNFVWNDQASSTWCTFTGQTTTFQYGTGAAIAGVSDVPKLGMGNGLLIHDTKTSGPPTTGARGRGWIAYVGNVSPGEPWAYSTISAGTPGVQVPTGYLAPTNQVVTPLATAPTANNLNLTAANIIGGMISVDLILSAALGAGATATLPTAAALVAAIPGAYAGMSYDLFVSNASSGAFDWTMTTNTGWTLSGTQTVAQNTWRKFVVTLTNVTASSEAATFASTGQIGTYS